MSRRLAREWRVLGGTIWTAGQLGRKTLPDSEQLAFSTGLGWVILTSNVHDYARLHTVWPHGGRTHAGIIVLTEQQLPVTLRIRALQLLTAEVPDDVWQSRLEYLMNWVARLPD